MTTPFTSKMSSSRGNQGVLRTSDDLLICMGCGTQYPVTAESGKDQCAVCDDPRQFVPPEGQSFTTLAKMREEYRNEWWQDAVDERIWFCQTVPQVSVTFLIAWGEMGVRGTLTMGCPVLGW